MTRSARTDDFYDEPDQLRDQLRQLLRYRALIILGVLLGLAGAVLLSVTGGDEYTSTGEVVVQPISTSPFETGGVSADKLLSMGTEKRIAQSASVSARAAKKLGVDDDGLRRDLRVSNPPDTQTLRFEFTASTPRQAARGANAFLQAYLEYREDAVVKRIDASVGRLNAELKPLTSQRESLDSKIATAADGPAKQADESERGSLVTYINELRNKISTLKSLDTTPGDVVREGEPPAYPSGPGLKVLLVVGAVLGLAAGLVLAWVRSVLEPRVRSVQDVQRNLRAPVLGILPRHSGEEGILVVGHTRHSNLAEAYRTIAFRIAHDQKFTGRGSLLVVAPRESTDAAAVGVNLAGAFAEIGHETLLIEADLRNPRLATELPLIGVPSTPDAATWPEGRPVAVDAGEAGEFHLIPGRRVPNVARTLSSPHMTRTLAVPADPHGRDRSLVVVTRPLLTHADALAVAKRVDGVIVVCDMLQVRRDDLDRVWELINGAGGRVVGAVLDKGDRHGPLRRLVDGGPAQRKPRREASGGHGAYEPWTSADPQQPPARGPYSPAR